jgi:hypothetical protein
MLKKKKKGRTMKSQSWLELMPTIVGERSLLSAKSRPTMDGGDGAWKVLAAALFIHGGAVWIAASPAVLMIVPDGAVQIAPTLVALRPLRGRRWERGIVRKRMGVTL